MDPTPPSPMGAWRLLSIVAVIAILAASGLHLKRGVEAADLGPQTNRSDITGLQVHVQGFGNPVGMRIVVVGAEAEVVHPVGPDGRATGIVVPSGTDSVLAVEGQRGELVGLAIVNAERTASDPAVRVTPKTTAHALVATAPGVLTAGALVDPAALDEPALTDLWGQLVGEVARAGDLSQTNPTLELRLAQVADAISTEPPAAPPCSTITTTAACMRSTPDGPLVTTGSRWIVLFPDAQITPCAVIAPATLDAPVPAACGSRVAFVTTGPFQPSEALDTNSATGIVTSQLDMTAGLTAIATWSLPFAELALGGFGATEPVSEVGPQIRRSSADILALVTQSDGKELASSVHRSPGSPSERIRAELGLARIGISSPRFGDLLATLGSSYNPTPNGGALLALHERSVSYRRPPAASSTADVTWDLLNLTDVDR